MLKVYKQKATKYNGLLYRARDVIADELYLERLLKVPEAIVVSSWRSLAEQKIMVANGKSKNLNSNHRRGMACDIVNWKELQEKLRKVGLMNDISWDRNHFAYDSEAKATRFPLIDALPKKLEEYKGSDKPSDKVERNKIDQEPQKKENDTEVPPKPIQSVESGNNPQIIENNMNITGYRTILSAVLAFLVTMGAISQVEANQLTEGVLALLSLATLASTVYFRIKAKK